MVSYETAEDVVTCDQCHARLEEVAECRECGRQFCKEHTVTVNGTVLCDDCIGRRTTRWIKLQLATLAVATTRQEAITRLRLVRECVSSYLADLGFGEEAAAD